MNEGGKGRHSKDFFFGYSLSNVLDRALLQRVMHCDSVCASSLRLELYLAKTSQSRPAKTRQSIADKTRQEQSSPE